MAATQSNVAMNARLGAAAAAAAANGGNPVAVQPVYSVATESLGWDTPAYADAGGVRINITLHHPVYGAIPFTLDPNDTGAEFDTKALHDAVVAAGGIAAFK